MLTFAVSLSLAIAISGLFDANIPFVVDFQLSFPRQPTSLQSLHNVIPQIVYSILLLQRHHQGSLLPLSLAMLTKVTSPTPVGC